VELNKREKELVDLMFSKGFSSTEITLTIYFHRITSKDSNVEVFRGVQKGFNEYVLGDKG
jgi:hypothetical protein